MVTSGNDYNCYLTCFGEKLPKYNQHRRLLIIIIISILVNITTQIFTQTFSIRQWTSGLRCALINSANNLCSLGIIILFVYGELELTLVVSAKLRLLVSSKAKLEKKMGHLAPKHEQLIISMFCLGQRFYFRNPLKKPIKMNP